MAGSLLLFAMICVAVSALAELRTWKDNNGNSIEAEFKGMNGSKGNLYRKDGKNLEVDVNNLTLFV